MSVSEDIGTIYIPIQTQKFLSEFETPPALIKKKNKTPPAK